MIRKKYVIATDRTVVLSQRHEYEYPELFSLLGISEGSKEYTQAELISMRDAAVDPENISFFNLALKTMFKGPVKIQIS